MATNQRIFETDCFENWYLYNDNLRHADGIGVLADTPGSREFVWHFRPYTTRYLSSLNAAFLVDLPELTLLKKRSIWLIRDGMVPLLWFFRKNPKPADLKSRILVHEDLAHLVPQAWAKMTGSYRFVLNHGNDTRPTKEPSRLLLAGLVSESFCDVKTLKKRLDAIVEHFGKDRFAKLRKSVALSIRPDGYLPEDPTRFQFQFMAETLKRIGMDFDIWNLEDIKLVSDWSDTYFHDFNEGVIIADGYLDHLVAGKGGIVLKADGKPAHKGTLADGEHYVPCSPYHGMVVRQTIPDVSPKLRPKFDAVIEQVMMSATNQYYPWPRWLHEWVQEQRQSGQ